MANERFEIELPHPDDTDRLGKALAKALTAVHPNGFALRLEGDLGAGKTTLVRAALRALGWTGPVKSPTFALVETYPLEAFEFNHFDFYRFEDPEEFEDAGFRDMFGPGRICATEWSERAGRRLPAADLIVTLSHKGLGRHASLEACSSWGKQVLICMTEMR